MDIDCNLEHNEISVLEKNSDSEWGCGTFIRPKKPVTLES
jgi:hypothetical protein